MTTLSKPNIGDKTSATKLGYKTRGTMIWARCLDCGAERWVTTKSGNPTSNRCYTCGHKHVRQLLKGKPRKCKGYYKSNGYVWKLVRETHPLYCMTNKNGYIAEHRLVMAEHLNRPLQAWEVVHHQNHIRDDNRLSNLLLLPSSSEHFADIKLRGYINGLEKRILILEAENILLHKGGQ